MEAFFAVWVALGVMAQTLELTQATLLIVRAYFLHGGGFVVTRAQTKRTHVQRVDPKLVLTVGVPMGAHQVALANVFFLVVIFIEKLAIVAQWH